MRVNLESLEMKPHPKFEGVKIGFIVTKERHPELSITVLEIQPGVEVPIHYHEREVDSILVLSGRGKAFIGDSWQDIGPRDVLVMPPGLKHGVKNDGDEPLVCYIVHAPALW